jgi:hypothetical protein
MVAVLSRFKLGGVSRSRFLTGDIGGAVFVYAMGAAFGSDWQAWRSTAEIRSIER